MTLDGHSGETMDRTTTDPRDIHEPLRVGDTPFEHYVVEISHSELLSGHCSEHRPGLQTRNGVGSVSRRGTRGWYEGT